MDSMKNLSYLYISTYLGRKLDLYGFNEESLLFIYLATYQEENWRHNGFNEESLLFIYLFTISLIYISRHLWISMKYLSYLYI